MVHSSQNLTAQEMLRKLALHLAAQPDGTENVTVGTQAPKDVAPTKVDESPERVRHFCDLAVG